jgi:thioredoxin 1
MKNYDPDLHNDTIAGNKLYFMGAPWCAPCKSFKPQVIAALADRPDVEGIYISIDEHPSLSNAFGVSSVPTVVLVKDGDILASHRQAAPKATIVELLNSTFGRTK